MNFLLPIIVISLFNPFHSVSSLPVDSSGSQVGGSLPGEPASAHLDVNTLVPGDIVKVQFQATKRALQPRHGMLVRREDDVFHFLPFYVPNEFKGISARDLEQKIPGLHKELLGLPHRSFSTDGYSYIGDNLRLVLLNPHKKGVTEILLDKPPTKFKNKKVLDHFLEYVQGFKIKEEDDKYVNMIRKSPAVPSPHPGSVPSTSRTSATKPRPRTDPANRYHPYTPPQGSVRASSSRNANSRQPDHPPPMQPYHLEKGPTSGVALPPPGAPGIPNLTAQEFDSWIGAYTLDSFKPPESPPHQPAQAGPTTPPKRPKYDVYGALSEKELNELGSFLKHYEE